MGYRMSNPCVLAVMALHGSLQVFSKTSMQQLREKSLKLTGYLEQLLDALSKKYLKEEAFEIITPRDVNQRGCQISVSFSTPVLMEYVFKIMSDHAVICDERRPQVIRISPAPLYNSFKDVAACIKILDHALESYYKK